MTVMLGDPVHPAQSLPGCTHLGRTMWRPSEGFRACWARPTGTRWLFGDYFGNAVPRARLGSVAEPGRSGIRRRRRDGSTDDERALPPFDVNGIDEPVPPTRFDVLIAAGEPLRPANLNNICQFLPLVGVWTLLVGEPT